MHNTPQVNFCFKLHTLIGTTKALAVEPLTPSTLRGTKPHFNMSKPVISTWEFPPRGPAAGEGLWRKFPAIVKAMNRV